MTRKDVSDGRKREWERRGNKLKFIGERMKAGKGVKDEESGE